MFSFDFLYDDEAKGPMSQFADAIGSAASKVKETVSQAFDTPTGKSVKTAASIGLVIGVFLATITVVGAAGSAVARGVFGDD